MNKQTHFPYTSIYEVIDENNPQNQVSKLYTKNDHQNRLFHPTQKIHNTQTNNKKTKQIF